MDEKKAADGKSREAIPQVGSLTCPNTYSSPMVPPVCPPRTAAIMEYTPPLPTPQCSPTPMPDSTVTRATRATKDTRNTPASTPVFPCGVGGKQGLRSESGHRGSTDHHPYALRGEPAGKRQRQHHRGEAWKKFQVSRVFSQQTLQDFQALTSQVKATSYPQEAPPGLSPLHLPTLPSLSRQLPHRCTGCPSGDLTAPSPPPSYP